MNCVSRKDTYGQPTTVMRNNRRATVVEFGTKGRCRMICATTLPRAIINAPTKGTNGVPQPFEARSS